MKNHQVFVLWSCLLLVVTACSDDFSSPVARAAYRPRFSIVGGGDSVPYGVNVGYLHPSNLDQLGFPWPTFTDHRSYLSLAKSAGVHWIRVAFAADCSVGGIGNWDGSLNTSSFVYTAVDSTVQMAVDETLSVLGSITPCDQNQFPDTALFRVFVANVLHKWGGRVKYWNIGNEPNSFLHENGNLISGTRYADMVNAVAPTVHDSGGTVVAGEVADGPGSLTFLGDFLSAPGAASNTDIVGFHIYDVSTATDSRHVYQLMSASWIASASPRSFGLQSSGGRTARHRRTPRPRM